MSMMHFKYRQNMGTYVHIIASGCSIKEVRVLQFTVSPYTEHFKSHKDKNLCNLLKKL